MGEGCLTARTGGPPAGGPGQAPAGARPNTRTERASVKDACDLLDIRYLNRHPTPAGWLYAWCPNGCRNSSNGRKQDSTDHTAGILVAYHDGDGVFKCHKCGLLGGPVGLVMQVRNVPLAEALAELRGG